MPVRAARRRPANRTLLYIGGAVLLLVLLLWLRSRNAAAAATDSSGTPGPDLTGSAAQQPSGGASSIPGQLPSDLLTAPDTLQQQVQQTNAASPDVSSSTQAAAFSTQTQTAPLGTAYVTPSPTYFNETVDPYAGYNVPHDVVVQVARPGNVSGSSTPIVNPTDLGASNVRRPGAQL